MFQWVRVFFLSFAFVATLTSFSQKTVLISDTLEEICLSREYVKYFEDENHLPVEEIEKRKLSQFKESHFEDLINFKTENTYWLIFKIKNNTSAVKPFRLELFDFDIDHIKLYKKTDRGYQLQSEGGYTKPFDDREINHKNVSFTINPLPGQTNYYLMSFRSSRTNILEPMLRSYDRLINYSLTEYLSLGIFYGLLLLIIFYYIVYAIFIKHKYYYYFILYAFGILIYFVSVDGTGFQFLWYNMPSLNHYMNTIGQFIAILGLILFTRTYLETNIYVPVWNKTFRGIIITKLFLLITELNFPESDVWEFINVSIIQLILLISILRLIRKPDHTKWFLYAFICLDIGFIISFLEHTNTITSNIFTVYSLNTGFILQFLLLSVGFGEAIKFNLEEQNQLQNQLINEFKKNEELKNQVKKELEMKILERTSYLEKAKKEIEEKVDEINKANKELDIANYQLKTGMNELIKQTCTTHHISYKTFLRGFSSELVCKKFLYELKNQKYFECKKCGGKEIVKGKEKFDRRCGKCAYNESLTANTIFHRTKIPLQKGFYILYITANSKEDIPINKLAALLDLPVITCSGFKKKALERIETLETKTFKPTWVNLILS